MTSTIYDKIGYGLTWLIVGFIIGTIFGAIFTVQATTNRWIVDKTSYTNQPIIYGEMNETEKGINEVQDNNLRQKPIQGNYSYTYQF